MTSADRNYSLWLLNAAGNAWVQVQNFRKLKWQLGLNQASHFTALIATRDATVSSLMTAGRVFRITDQNSTNGLVATYHNGFASGEGGAGHEIMTGRLGTPKADDKSTVGSTTSIWAVEGYGLMEQLDSTAYTNDTVLSNNTETQLITELQTNSTKQGGGNAFTIGTLDAGPKASLRLRHGYVLPYLLKYAIIGGKTSHFLSYIDVQQNGTFDFTPKVNYLVSDNARFANAGTIAQVKIIKVAVTDELDRVQNALRVRYSGVGSSADANFFSPSAANTYHSNTDSITAFQQRATITYMPEISTDADGEATKQVNGTNVGTATFYATTLLNMFGGLGLSNGGLLGSATVTGGVVTITKGTSTVSGIRRIEANISSGRMFGTVLNATLGQTLTITTRKYGSITGVFMNAAYDQTSSSLVVTVGIPYVPFFETLASQTQRTDQDQSTGDAMGYSGWVRDTASTRVRLTSWNDHVDVGWNSTLTLLTTSSYRTTIEKTGASILALYNDSATAAGPVAFLDFYSNDATASSLLKVGRFEYDQNANADTALLMSVGTSSGTALTNLLSLRPSTDATYGAAVVSHANLLPSATTTYDLGTSSFKWRNIVASGSVTTGSLVVPDSAFWMARNDGPNGNSSGHISETGLGTSGYSLISLYLNTTDEATTSATNTDYGAFQQSIIHLNVKAKHVDTALAIMGLNLGPGDWAYIENQSPGGTGIAIDSHSSTSTTLSGTVSNTAGTVNWTTTADLTGSLSGRSGAGTEDGSWFAITDAGGTERLFQVESITSTTITTSYKSLASPAITAVQIRKKTGAYGCRCYQSLISGDSQLCAEYHVTGTNGIGMKIFETGGGSNGNRALDLDAQDNLPMILRRSSGGNGVGFDVEDTRQGVTNTSLTYINSNWKFQQPVNHNTTRTRFTVIDGSSNHLFTYSETDDSDLILGFNRTGASNWKVDFRTTRPGNGSGGAATLGNVGGTGRPVNAAQNDWLPIRIGGTDYWIPVWT